MRQEEITAEIIDTAAGEAATVNVRPDPAVPHPMAAADIMTRDVATVQVDSALCDAVQLMITRQVSGLPVLSASGALIGMLTESDLLRRTETGTEAAPRWLQAVFDPGLLAERFAHARGRRVSEVMTRDVVSVVETTPLRDVVALMQDHDFGRVPVMQGHSLVGVVARADLVRALGRVLRAQPPGASPAPGDVTIRQTLEADLAAAAWCSKDLRFTVTDGRVHLYGSLRDDRNRAAIQIAAENVPGVVSVQAHFTDPDQGALIGFGPND